MFDGLIEVERTDTDIVVVPGAFLGIRKNVDLAIELAEIESTRKTTLIFNDVSIRVESSSDPKLITRDYGRVAAGYISGPVGPFPAPQLSSEEVESDNRIDREDWSAHMKALAQRQLASIDTQDAAGVH